MPSQSGINQLGFKTVRAFLSPSGKTADNAAVRP